MNIQQLTQIMTESGIEQNEATCEMKMLLEHFCNYTEIDKIKGKELTEAELKLIEEKVLQRIKDKSPIQYIIGKAWFMGEYFKVNKNTLIPRDETEILVRKAIDIIKKYNLKSVLDIGTGSGCIACTIAKNTDAVVLGTDISSEALMVALDNVTGLGINNKAVFRKSDLFSKIHEDEKFDLIISNPPYIPHGEDLQPEVLHEPHTALFAGDNGLEFYTKIIEHAPEHLNSGGYLMFELGAGESGPVRDLMKSNFGNIDIIKDLAGIDRVIIGKLIK